MNNSSSVQLGLSLSVSRYRYVPRHVVWLDDLMDDVLKMKYEGVNNGKEGQERFEYR